MVKSLGNNKRKTDDDMLKKPTKITEENIIKKR